MAPPTSRAALWTIGKISTSIQSFYLQPPPALLRLHRPLLDSLFPPPPSRTFPSTRLVSERIPPNTPTVYRFESPTQRGYTTDGLYGEWCWDKVPPDTSVRAVHKQKKKNKHNKNTAWVVFFREKVWCILFLPRLRRPGSMPASAVGPRASHETSPMHNLPQPMSPDANNQNPLHGSDPGDDRWFVVYRGITPGVYRSYLESQLNTTGIPNSSYQAV
ncbi:hypothetical protein R3P38DRAFT_2814965 [Favolaschia claudopus]|uniref:Ribonuclease H1 N-terminal domain-containing protein n=1 Tax=Favolaschia claudopus TaxID=2862362 RepID=A0AAV9Z2D7_9AGAR